MASNKFSLSVNQDYTATTVSSGSDPSADVECVIKGTLTAEQAYILLEKLSEFISKRGTT